MKKFLFTLAALLMATVAFAQTDAKYLYVSDVAPDTEVENGLILTISAEFPGYINAFEATINCPEGLTVSFLEPGADAEITYKNAAGRNAKLTPAIATSGTDQAHFIVAISTAGFWQDPNGENPSAWVSYGAVKWAAGTYEEFILAYCEYDDTFHGGNVTVTTIPSSGEDTRPDPTITDLGDKSVPHITPAVEDIEDPNPTVEVTDKPVITYVDDEAGHVTVTATGNGHICLYNDDILVAEGEGSASYVITYGDDPEGEEYGFSATAKEEGKEVSEYALKDVFVPGKTAVAAPVINTTMDDDNVYVTITWPTSTGEQKYDGEYTYARPEYGQPDESYDVEAYVEGNDMYKESTHATKTIEVPAKDPQWVDGTAPVIEFVETKDGEVVTAVDVVVENYTDYNINGQPFNRATVAHYDANYTEDQVITVNAVNDQGYPYRPAYATESYTLKKLDKKAVEAPVINQTVGDTEVTVTISWPTTDGDQVYTGEYTYQRTNEDQTFDVEAYTTEGATYAESEHATATIEVPALPQQEKTTAPNVAAEGHSTPVVNDQGQQIGTENGYYEVTISGSEEGAVIEYRITDADGVGEWQVYDGTPLIFDEDGQYTVEARAKVEGKDYSDVTSATFVVTERTSIDELVNGKAVASVRYFNLAGQEMQEANGMTIVVTTYTDGSTSAVKVMK